MTTNELLDYRMRYVESLWGGSPKWSAKTQGRLDWELEVCKGSIVHWIRHWIFTYDPRTKLKFIPFDPFPIQEKFLAWIKRMEDEKKRGLCEKSRDIGASFLACAYALHKWRFVPGAAIGFGSNKEVNVDDRGNPKALFQKIRQMLYKLPKWQLPKGFDRDKHDNIFKLINPETDATITGEAGPNIGMGGRTEPYFVDEAAKLDDAEAVETALIGNTDVRIDISTPNGNSNQFARQRFSLPPDQVFSMHYRGDPRKTEEWVSKKKASTEDWVWAEQYEIDYSASLQGVVIPGKWVRAAVDLLPVPQTGPLVGGFDVGGEGKNNSVLLYRRGSVILPTIHSWSGVNPIESTYRARDHAETDGAAEVCFDANGIGSSTAGIWQTGETRFIATPVGAKVSDDYWPDGRQSKEKFLNGRAEGWWKVRTRFEKAYEHKMGIRSHPPEDMISIPDHPQLISELSSILVEHTDNGKIKLEGKRAMRARGVRSPDFADAAVYTFFGSGLPWEIAPGDRRTSIMASAPVEVPMVGQEDDKEWCMADLIDRMGM